MTQKPHKRVLRMRRHVRVRAKISGTAERPRVTVFRSNQHIHAQAINDTSNVTVASVNDAALGKKKATKSEQALAVGEQLAAKLKELGVTKVVFDVSGFTYHGRVKAVAEGLRAGGINV